MKARWPWLGVLALLFVGGAVAGWVFSGENNTDRPAPRERASGQSRLDRRIEQLEDEVEKEHGKRQAEKQGLLPGDPEAVLMPHTGGMAALLGPSTPADST